MTPPWSPRSRTAGGFGADVLTHCRAESVDDLRGNGSVNSAGGNAAVHLNVEGEILTVNASAVVNATGV